MTAAGESGWKCDERRKRRRDSLDGSWYDVRTMWREQYDSYIEWIPKDVAARMTPSERLQAAIELSEKLRARILADIRQAHPEWPEAEVKREFIRGHFPPDETPPFRRADER